LAGRVFDVVENEDGPHHCGRPGGAAAQAGQDDVTWRFVELYEEIGPSPVQLHDLRHGAATPAHAAGADLKDIQETLSHSSITITADTYTSLLPEADLAIAETAARPTASPRRLRGHRFRSGARARWPGEGRPGGRTG
jgi:hypothetical protein